MITYNGSKLPSQQSLVAFYQENLESLIDAGVYRPIILPRDLFGICLFVGYLCIPHVEEHGRINRKWLHAARYPLAVFLVAFYADILRKTRSSFMGSGFGVGLLAAWFIAWSITWLVLEDPQRTAKRIEVVLPEDVNRSVIRQVIQGGVSESQYRADHESHSDSKPQNGFPEMNGHENGAVNTRATKLIWQSYPLTSFWARLNWVNDLVYNFRGPGWNWELKTNPALPSSVLRALGEEKWSKHSGVASYIGTHRYESRALLARHLIPKFAFGYLLLDFLKVYLMRDPYFLLGPIGDKFPHPYPVADVYVPFVRRVAALAGIITALETIFTSGGILFCLVLGPSVLGLRGEAWMYPTTWGSLGYIGERGLNGLWSGWWHQTFRYAFIAPTKFLVKNGYLKKNSLAAHAVNAVVAFGISGFLHLSGSYTQLGTSHPLELFSFFELQALGIFIQIGIAKYFHDQILRVPKVLRQLSNLIFAFGWLYVTSALIVDDFARGGIWLFEPVPFSLIKALRYENKNDSWIRWDFSDVGWYDGGKWWLRGLRF